MKNIIIGFILGLVLSLPISTLAYVVKYTEFEERVLELLVDIERHGEDISSDTQTLIDSISRLPRE